MAGKSRVVKQLSILDKLTFTTKKPQIIINPTKYQSLKLTFQVQNHNGHMGARKFWREYLPTLKFYNPNFDMNVTRIKNDDKLVQVPCVLEILDEQGKSLETINMKNKRSEDIMDEFLSKIDYEVISEDKLIKFSK
ncbi:mitochondrial 54S ribosomal protein mL61 MRP49 PWA37_002749 [Arxiozyma heterogenica]|uniref:Ribosomal protein/NADH dehydrogenase domain-containing protein n=1 Tax=Arxiozyma heterogenica TaxID=278026 RepID=A0AAN7WGL2_9SACH|nr:hypothetical protein RI543_003465 [Kazachstania heterogenica]